MHTPRTLAIVAACLALSVSACGKAPEPAPKPGPSQGQAAPSQPVNPLDPPTTPPEGTEFTFDQAARYDDGVTIEVGTIRPDRVTATQHGAEGTSGQVVIADILITNKSQAPFVADKVAVRGYYSGVGAPKIADTSGAVGDSFRGTVAPGQQAKATIGFAMPADQLGDVAIVIDGGDDTHGPLQFKGKVG